MDDGDIDTLVIAETLSTVFALTTFDGLSRPMCPTRIPVPIQMQWQCAIAFAGELNVEVSARTAIRPVVVWLETASAPIMARCADAM